MEKQPGLDESKLIRALVRILDMVDDTPEVRKREQISELLSPEP